MRMTQLFTRTARQSAEAETSLNAQLLTRAGYVSRLMGGVYNILPLGLLVLQNIEAIIREEMNAIGGQEVLLPILQPRELWQATGRWDTVDILYKLASDKENDLTLVATAEEVVTAAAAVFVHSWRDLPFAAYQIHTKFRREARPKSGMLRGREFRMKDMYSFARDEAGLNVFYERTIPAYQKIYARCGIGERTVLTMASGGIFSKYSHEFQTLSESGEDTIYRMPGGTLAINSEVLNDPYALAQIIPNYQSGDEQKLEAAKAIEVGNIFKLGTKYADALGMGYTDATGARQSVWMGCYGIGSTRLMGTIAECLGDKDGLVWPDYVAPMRLHLVSLARTPEEVAEADRLDATFRRAGITVLYDDRPDVQAGEKLSDADLLGLPHRLVISPRTLKEGKVEYKARVAHKDAAQLLSPEELINMLRA